MVAVTGGIYGDISVSGIETGVNSNHLQKRYLNPSRASRIGFIILSSGSATGTAVVKVDARAAVRRARMLKRAMVQMESWSLEGWIL